jgi:hypothetical protein
MTPSLARRAVPALLAALAFSCDAPEPLDEVAPRRPASPNPSAPVEPRARVGSGRVYVPIYSHIYVEDGIAEDLAITVSVHNVSTDGSLILESVRYYDTGGKSLEEFVESDAVLRPLETVEFFVPRGDRRGGSGGNVIVTWQSDSPVEKPLVEAIAVRRTANTSQSYAFSTRGVEIATTPAHPE